MRRGRTTAKSRRKTDDTRVNRSATLIVVDRNGNPLGAFGPIVASMHVQDTSDLTELAAAAGVNVTILRVLGAPIVEPSGVIRCMYLAEALGPVVTGELSALPPDLDLSDH